VTKTRLVTNMVNPLWSHQRQSEHSEAIYKAEAVATLAND